MHAWSKVYRLTLLVAVAGSFLMQGSSASGHSAAFYYPHVWAAGYRPFGCKFDPTFPRGNKHDRVKDAFATWNNVTNVNFSFNFNGVAGSTYNPANPCNGDYNGVFERDNTDYGITSWCIGAQGHINRFSIRMQTGSDTFWDTGNADDGRNVYQSVIVHEAGHAGGFGTKIVDTGDPADQHFPHAYTSDGICWDDADFHTMCNGLIPAPPKTRTLEEHDIETFRNAY
jgi:hypothetical protein